MNAKRAFPRCVFLLLAGAHLICGSLLAADAVNVSIEADAAALAVGESATVTVYGQIAPSIVGSSDQIFSWYIDVLNDNGAVVNGYDNLQTPASDNHPDTSGDGTVEGSNLRGVYDTFLFHAGAGKGGRVVLVQFEVTARAAGTASFRVAPGTTVGPLSDFLVSKAEGGAFTGGVYSGAVVEITVTGELDLSGLGLMVKVVGNQAEVTFNPVAGFDHTVQFSDTLLPLSWADVPGGPHNAGIVNQTIPGIQKRFYRVALTPQ